MASHENRPSGFAPRIGDVVYGARRGEVLEAALKRPATGPIGLEGDRGMMEYRPIRLKELP